VSAFVTVRVNGDPVKTGTDTTVAQLVEGLGCGTRGVAVAVNRELVRKAQWPSTCLVEGDEVEVLRAAAGG
jgi:sulfur carrier protein